MCGFCYFIMNIDWNIVVNSVIAIGTLVTAFIAYRSSQKALKSSERNAQENLELSQKILEQQIRHDHLSVKPLPEIIPSDYENEISITIKNSGVGPVIIKHFICSKGDYCFDQLWSECPELPENLFFTDYLATLYDHVILNGDSIDIIKINFDESLESHREYRCELRQFLSELKFELDYTDIYGNKFPKEENSGIWYKRNL